MSNSGFVQIYIYIFDMFQIYTLFSRNLDSQRGCKSGARLYSLKVIPKLTFRLMEDVLQVEKFSKSSLDLIFVPNSRQTKARFMN